MIWEEILNMENWFCRKRIRKDFFQPEFLPGGLGKTSRVVFFLKLISLRPELQRLIQQVPQVLKRFLG